MIPSTALDDIVKLLITQIGERIGAQIELNLRAALRDQRSAPRRPQFESRSTLPAEKWNAADQDAGYPFGVDGLMSVVEACAFLGGISHDTLYRRCAEGKIRRGRHAGNGKACFCRRSMAEYAHGLEL